MVTRTDIRARINIIEKDEASVKFYEGLEKGRHAENTARWQCH